MSHPCATELAPLLTKIDAVLIGPGLGDAADLAQTTYDAALAAGRPMVIDADAIRHLHDHQIHAHPAKAAPIILTPHAAERQALLGTHDLGLLHANFSRPNRLVLAKGAIDFLTDGQRWQLNHFGNPRLAMGGTGDLLAGLTTGLLARGAAPFGAMRAAVLWLTRTGDHLFQQLGPHFTNDDLLKRLGPQFISDTAARR